MSVGKKQTGLRLLKWLTVGVAAVSLVWIAHVQVQQRLFRYRAERLLADFKSLRLERTTWPEAQGIMARWKKDGTSRGSCTATSCAYSIDLETGAPMPSALWEAARGRLAKSGLLRARNVFRVPLSHVSMRFLVQDGVVVRTWLFVITEGEPFALFVEAEGRDSLRNVHDEHNAWLAGNDEQLDLHSSYKIGPIGACTGCEMTAFHYAPEVTSSDLSRLLDVKLECITRFRACRHIEDLAPEITAQHLRENSARALSGSRPCRTDLRALGRDSENILSVEATSAVKIADPETADPVPGYRQLEAEKTQVGEVAVVYGPASVAGLRSFVAIPYEGEADQEQSAYPAEHFLPGHRYLIRPPAWPMAGDVELPRCGVLEDTEENRRELLAGAAQQVKLRVPELSEGWK